jgi:hypothetical protein
MTDYGCHTPLLWALPCELWNFYIPGLSLLDASSTPGQIWQLKMAVDIPNILLEAKITLN